MEVLSESYTGSDVLMVKILQIVIIPLVEKTGCQVCL